MKRLLSALLVLLTLTTWAAEVMPPAPAKFFNDYAGVVPAATVARLNQTLEDFERATSSQIVIAVFPKMQSDSSIEDYTFRVKESWKVGQKDENNGAVLFVFTQDRKMYLQVGYGLEGALPDALCKRIIEDEIKPHFKAGDFGAGLEAGVTAILAATKGEYKGTGTTQAQSYRRSGNEMVGFKIALFIIFMLIVISASKRGRGRGGYYSSSGWSSGWSSGGGSSGGSSGGFSGGGGSGGGGGAGGSW